MKKVEALMAVMRKMLLVAYRLLRTEETYDPRKVGVAPVPHPPSSGQLAAIAPPPYEYGHRRAMKMGKRSGMGKEEIG